MPFLQLEPDPASSDPDLPGKTQTVWFTDPRFMGDTPLLHRGGRSPLTGEVVLGRGNEVLAEGMDGRFGR